MARQNFRLISGLTIITAEANFNGIIAMNGCPKIPKAKVRKILYGEGIDVYRVNKMSGAFEDIQVAIGVSGIARKGGC